MWKQNFEKQLEQSILNKVYITYSTYWYKLLQSEESSFLQMLLDYGPISLIQDS